MYYREFTIPKKNGKARKICAPDAELKKYQRHKLYELEHYYRNQVESTNIEYTAHGFIKGRNVVTAAKQHTGFRSTIMMDLSNFFDTVHRSMIPEEFRDDDNLFHKDGYCAQGLVTSPILANIASIKMLEDIKSYLAELRIKFAFTIYADDLQISTDYEEHTKLNNIIKDVENIITASGFRVNTKKTRIKYAKFGFRRILGVNVGDTEVRATRKVMRKIRAAKHQQNKSSLGGLVTWSKCMLPNPSRKSDRINKYKQNQRTR